MNEYMYVWVSEEYMCVWRVCCVCIFVFVSKKRMSESPQLWVAIYKLSVLAIPNSILLLVCYSTEKSTEYLTIFNVDFEKA